MARLTIRINGRPVTVYAKKDAWRGGIAALRRAERGLYDFGPRRMIRVAPPGSARSSRP